MKQKRYFHLFRFIEKGLNKLMLSTERANEVRETENKKIEDNN